MEIKTGSPKLSKGLSTYLLSLRKAGRYEVYETVLLMLLNDRFRNALDASIRDNIARFKPTKGITHIEIKTSKEYESALDEVCKSAYFIKNFSYLEIKRRKTIASNIIVEIVYQCLPKILGKHYPTIADARLSVNFHDVIFPLISHNSFKDEELDMVSLSFPQDESLDNVVRYLKDIVGVKNRPKRKKVSLGEAFRVLEANEYVRNNRGLGKKRKGEYLEMLISREMKKRYGGKTLTMEAVSMHLRRIKKIKKEINTKGDK